MTDRLKTIRKNKGMESMKKTLNYSLSDADIRTILGHGAKIVEYKDLSNYEDMDDLLPNEKDYVIVLVESKPNSGHWCAITKGNGTITLFDSYGSKIQDELNFISKAMNRMLGQTKGELDRLIDSVPDHYEVVYNKDRLQAEKPDIATCGRWTSLFVTMFKDMNYDLHDFLEFIENQIKETGLPPDVLVCKYIPLTK